ncbi:hypothetical protein [Algibacter sp. 2305UL17-15]|uniref:hypothetical protein n=1 Tax=Algibacter sp. 2305UL17-15 TaxID=3231268 RepID=UPI00345AAF59
MNLISNSGNATHTGVANTLTSTGNGVHIGVDNNINSATGDSYGVKTDIATTDSGQTSYGIYNDLNLVSGTGYAGWFTATGSGTTYAAVFDDGAVVVNESGNDNDTRIEGQSDNDLIFVDASADMVGIGLNNPSEKLEVNGTIKATDINFTGLPVYADDAAAVTGGLTTGDMYRTATGELRIKL